jgi:tungstate transport system substrate-binding protein
MFKSIAKAVVLAALCTLLAGAAQAEEKSIMMSTTTSTQASGLLDVLLPEFTKDTGITVKVIAKGTGAAIRDGMDGNVDVIFVHAKAREQKFVDEGYGTKRYAVMHNDFVILGPKADPAGLGGTSDAVAALEKIAGAKALFVSRGDDSGTHTKEQNLWKATDLELEKVSKEIVKKGKTREVSFVAPKGDWYRSVGQGMGKSLTIAEEMQAYILADRGTYLKYSLGRDQGLDLDIRCEGDPKLYNPYGVIPVNPEKFSHVKHDMARQFAEWLVSKRGQSLIAGYQLLGKQLFYPDAMPDVEPATP